MNRSRSPILVVDFKYNIIRIHRSTLMALGHPKFIELIVAPSKGIIGIRAEATLTPTAQRVNTDSLALQRSVQLYSTNLVRELLGLNPEWQNEQIYKMEGVLKDSERTVLFDISNSELVHSDEYAAAQ
ncbi:hypothetical protein [Butyrivibrio sp. INlla16]|uniref:hypothetical protein n=1 Tax=Butyrivibrio sp. INlla16 TaxID=1520807 RepID=UPI00087FF1F2|nr:hypothetical protein [Butyrivibrio sp. INlla16]SDB52046.1 hypothetical protein SAMN02910263_02626 [Butyrivibrio sp. INlla16]